MRYPINKTWNGKYLKGTLLIMDDNEQNRIINITNEPTIYEYLHNLLRIEKNYLWSELRQ